MQVAPDCGTFGEPVAPGRREEHPAVIGRLHAKRSDTTALGAMDLPDKAGRPGAAGPQNNNSGVVERPFWSGAHHYELAKHCRPLGGGAVDRACPAMAGLKLGRLGFGFAFAFVLCVLHHFAPEPDRQPGRKRRLVGERLRVQSNPELQLELQRRQPQLEHEPDQDRLLFPGGTFATTLQVSRRRHPGDLYDPGDRSKLGYHAPRRGHSARRLHQLHQPERAGCGC